MTTDRFEDTVKLVETATSRAGKITGQSGNNIENFKLTHGVKIYTTVNNKTLFIIRGDKQRTTKARIEMNKLIDDIKREDDRLDQVPGGKKDVSCRYHQARNCRYGTMCHSRHDQRPVAISTITTTTGRDNRPSNWPQMDSRKNQRNQKKNLKPCMTQTVFTVKPIVPGAGD